jgi:hypothetical protein
MTISLSRFVQSLRSLRTNRAKPFGHEIAGQANVRTTPSARRGLIAINPCKPVLLIAIYLPDNNLAWGNSIHNTLQYVLHIVYLYVQEVSLWKQN